MLERAEPGLEPRLRDAVWHRLEGAWGVPDGDYYTTLVMEDGHYAAVSHRLTDSTWLVRFDVPAEGPDADECAWQLWYRLTGRALSMAELRGEE